MSSHRNDPSGVWPNDYLPFTSTKDEIRKMMVGLGTFYIQANKIKIQDYLTRKEVATQMFKYNFDTMLWEWCCLGADDVLRAMRVAYNAEDETISKTV